MRGGARGRRSCHSEYEVSRRDNTISVELGGNVRVLMSSGNCDIETLAHLAQDMMASQEFQRCLRLSSIPIPTTSMLWWRCAMTLVPEHSMII